MSRRTHRRAAALGVVIVSLFTVGVANAAWTAQGAAHGKAKSGRLSVRIVTDDPTVSNVNPDGSFSFTPNLVPGERAELVFMATNSGDVSAVWNTTATSSHWCFTATLRANYAGISEGDGDRDIDFDPNEGAQNAVYVEVLDDPACMGQEAEITATVTASLSPSPRN